MNNKKYIINSDIKRKNRLFSWVKCSQQVEHLSKKSILSKFEQQQLEFFKDRLTQINLEAYMEEKPC